MGAQLEVLRILPTEILTIFLILVVLYGVEFINSPVGIDNCSD